MIYALLRSNVVTNVILADANFIAANPGLYDVAVDVTAGPQPSIGYIYNGSTFSPNSNLAQAKAQKIAAYQSAAQAFVTQAYSLDVRFNFNAMYLLALSAGNLPNRMAYISQLFTWAAAVVSYSAAFTSSVMAMSDFNVVNAAQWDFSQINAQDPLVNPMVAIQINN